MKDAVKLSNYRAQIEYYERKVFDLRQLIEISKGLNSTLEYNLLIESILLTCMGQMQLVKAGIFLKRNIDDRFFALHRNHKGFELDREIDYSISKDSPLAERMFAEARCFTWDEVRKDKSMDKAEVRMLASIAPSLLVPLKGKGKFHGFIVLGDRISCKEFCEEEMEYLMDIASLAGIAIENAYLYEVATTDMMTRLKIHHYFQTILAEEIEISRRNAQPMALLMIDIDNFKRFNDEHGHLCGDLVLKNVASLVKHNCRQIDTAARYGGEEIAVILGRTEMGYALNVAERIRRQIEASSVTHDGKELKATVSIGVAELDPAIEETNNTIITRADTALYYSKHHGKNRVSYSRTQDDCGEIDAYQED